MGTGGHGNRPWHIDAGSLCPWCILGSLLALSRGQICPLRPSLSLLIGTDCTFASHFLLPSLFLTSSFRPIQSSPSWLILPMRSTALARPLSILLSLPVPCPTLCAILLSLYRMRVLLTCTSVVWFAIRMVGPIFHQFHLVFYGASSGYSSSWRLPSTLPRSGASMSSVGLATLPLAHSSSLSLLYSSSPPSLCASTA